MTGSFYIAKLVAWLRRVARPLATSSFYLHGLGIPLLTATLAYTLVYTAAGRTLFASPADDALGRRMSLFKDTIAPRAGAVPIVVLDYDDATAQALNDPLRVPPPVVGRALQRLAPSRPWAVVIDIDFADRAAPDELAEARVGLAALSRQGTLVLLIREGSGSDLRRHWRATPIDQLVANLPGVLWASASYPRSNDAVVRELSPFVRMFGAEPPRLPSVPLALAVRARAASAALAEATIARALTQFSGGDEDIVVATPKGPLAVSPRPALIEFSLGWPPMTGAQPMIRVGNAQRFPAVRASMLPLLTAPARSTELFSRACVIIAATAEHRDLVETPIGEMPGAFVIANAVRAWLEFETSGSTSFLAGLVAVLVYTVLLALVAHAVLHAIRVFVRQSWRGWVQGQMPTVLTALVWAIFYFVGGPGLSVGLVLASYFIVLSVTIAHGRLHAPTARRDAP